MTLLESKLDRLDDQPLIAVKPRDQWDHEQVADIAKFREQLGRYQSGEMPEDVFRVFRLNNGIYGQRQGGTNQMVRIKLPAGTITPEQLDLMGFLSETYSRGWGHITTRQNVQMHYVQLDDIPDVMEHLASVGFLIQNGQAVTLASYDGTMTKAARSIGIDVYKLS